MSLDARKPVFAVSYQVRHKRVCAVSENGQKLEISDLEEEKFYYPSGETKGADQLRSYCESDLRLCFRICKIPVSSRCGSYYNVQMVRLGTSFPGQAQTRAVNQ